MKTSRILLTLTAGLVLATPLASFAEGTAAPAPAAATAEKADKGVMTHKHHHKHHARKTADDKAGDAAKPTTK